MWGCGGGTTVGKPRSASCSGESVSGFGLGSTIALSGSLTYEDRPLSTSGFTGAVTPRPIRFAKVGAVRSCDGTLLSAAFADAAGAYSLLFSNAGTAGIVARVWTQTNTALASVEVRSAFTGDLHQADSSVLDDSGLASLEAVIVHRVSVGSGAGAFNVLDLLTSASEFVQARTGSPPPLVTAYWASDNCNGTYFDAHGTEAFRTPNSIYLLGGGTTCERIDPDEYDDAVIAHEYGHFIAANFSVDDSPGGQHTLSSLDQDLRLAWSEGWGTFMGGALLAAAGSSIPEWYLDTGQSGACAICLNIETPSTSLNSPASFVYASNEVAVAAALWDIYDATPLESLPLTLVPDSLSAGIGPIWSVVTTYLPCGRLATRPLSSCPGLQSVITTVSMEDFWDGLVSQTSSLLASAVVVTKDRKMEFFLDSYEPDGSLPASRAISLNQVEHHTLYSVSRGTDVDVVALSAIKDITYTILTGNLTNGADTLLEVLDRATASTPYAVLASNDDATAVSKSSDCLPETTACPVNGSATLSSGLAFTPTATGTYYIRILRSPNAPPSAGAYGSYDLLVTSP